MAAPFLHAGLLAGEPTLVGFGDPHTELLRGALPYAGDIRFLSGGTMYARPASAIAAYRKLLGEYVADGAQQIRIIGELSRPTSAAPGNGGPATSRRSTSSTTSSPCGACAPTTPALRPVMCSPTSRVRTQRGHARRCAYAESGVPPAGRLPHHATHLVRRPPPARTAAGDARRPGAERDPATVENTNTVGLSAESVRPPEDRGQRGGDQRASARPPTDRGAYWAGDGTGGRQRHQQGRLPRRPVRGLRPAAHAPNGGLGLWLVHQLCDFVRFDHGTDGFTVMPSGSDQSAPCPDLVSPTGPTAGSPPPYRPAAEAGHHRWESWKPRRHTGPIGRSSALPRQGT